MPLTATFSIVHHDKEGQDGPIHIDIEAHGITCAHELAVFNYLKAIVEQIVQIPTDELDGISEAMTELTLHAMKTGKTFTRRDD